MSVITLPDAGTRVTRSAVPGEVDVYRLDDLALRLAPLVLAGQVRVRITGAAELGDCAECPPDTPAGGIAATAVVHHGDQRLIYRDEVCESHLRRVLRRCAHDRVRPRVDIPAVLR